MPLTKIRQSFVPETAGSECIGVNQIGTFYWRIVCAECLRVVAFQSHRFRGLSVSLGVMGQTGRHANNNNTKSRE